jgi:hypothetical protein
MGFNCFGRRADGWCFWRFWKKVTKNQINNVVRNETWLKVNCLQRQIFGRLYHSTNVFACIIKKNRKWINYAEFIHICVFFFTLHSSTIDAVIDWNETVDNKNNESF